MGTIYLTRGIQGSGKSTWAKKWVNEKPEERVRFNNDDIRNMLGKYWVTDREWLVTSMRENFLLKSMTKGYDIVIDNMNLNPKETSYYKNIIGAWNMSNPHNQYTIEYVDFFDVSVEECIERDSHRPNPIGEQVIRQTWKRYRTFILAELNKRQADLVNRENISLPHCIIVDIDATLSYNTHGRPFYGKGCAEGIYEDVPCYKMIRIVNNYYNTVSNNVFIVTGRESTDDIRMATEKWLNDNDVHFKVLYMRKPGDYRPGFESKKEIYDTYIKDKYNVDFVLEDSTKCVDMYREEGLLVLQPNNGKF